MVNNCDLIKMEILARVALDCVEEDRDIRPTMSQVVEMLQSHDKDVECSFSAVVSSSRSNQQVSTQVIRNGL
ncbi:hypothetical protein P8452_59722 [Trifolium repens]|nr:hypothetical protein P8452_59722 [Trifolium repens]